MGAKKKARLAEQKAQTLKWVNIIRARRGRLPIGTFHRTPTGRYDYNPVTYAIRGAHQLAGVYSFLDYTQIEKKDYRIPGRDYTARIFHPDYVKWFLEDFHAGKYPELVGGWEETEPDEAAYRIDREIGDQFRFYLGESNELLRSTEECRWSGEKNAWV